jgi:hypothetical protein
MSSEYERELELAQAAAKRRAEDTQRSIEIEEEQKAALDSPPVRGYFEDVTRSSVRGVTKALGAGVRLLSLPGEKYTETFGDTIINIGNGRPFIEVLSPEQAKVRNEKPNAVERYFDDTNRIIGAPQTVPGALSEGLSQFVTGVLVNRGAGLSGFSATGESALVAGVYFDGQDGNLADLVGLIPGIGEPVKEWLGTDEDDPEVVARLKNIITDAAGGKAFEAVFKALRVIKQGVRARRGADAVLDAEDAAIAADPVPTAGATPEVPATGPVEAPVKAPEGAPKTTVEALSEGTPRYSEVVDEGIGKIASRLGLTGEKLGALRQAVSRGLDPVEVEKIIDLNPGTIDWSGVRNAEDVVAMMNSITEVVGEGTARRAGYARQSIQHTAKQSELLMRETGGTVKDAMEQLERTRDLPAVVMMQRKLVTASATHLTDLAKSVSGGKAAPAELLEFLTHTRRHAVLQVVARGTRANVGRALRAMRETVDVNEAAGKLAKLRAGADIDEAKRLGKEIPDLPKGKNVTEREVKEALGRLGMKSEDVKDLATLILKSKKHLDLNRATRIGMFQRTQDWLNTLYINNILSGPPTLSINVFSGAYKLVETTIERYAGAAMARARGDKYAFRLANKHAIATWGSWRDAWRVAGAAFKEGAPQTDLIARSEVAATSHLDDASLFEKGITLPSRAILTIDEFFKHIFAQQEIAARAVEQASAAARGVKNPQRAESVFKTVFEDARANPSDETILASMSNARYATFQTSLNTEAGKAFIHFVNQMPFGRFIVPFIKTPSNILKQSIERSPLAALTPKFWRAIWGSAGTRAQHDAITRMALGSAAMASWWQLAADGRVTGTRKGGRGTGNSADLNAPASSIKIGDTWYSVSRLEPYGIMLTLTADLRDIMLERQDRNTNPHESDDMDFMATFGAVLGAFSENLASKTYFKGIADLMDAAAQIEDHGTADGIVRLLNTKAVALVPGSSLQRNMTRAFFDDFAREAFTAVDLLKAQTPGFSNDLPVRYDVLGRPIEHAARLGPDFISPFQVTKDDPDPVVRAFARLDMDYRPVPKKLNGIHLSAEQYSEYAGLRGKYLYEVLQPLSASLDAQSPEIGRIIVQQVMEGATKRATNEMLYFRYPELGATVNRNKAEAALIRVGQ